MQTYYHAVWLVVSLLACGLVPAKAAEGSITSEQAERIIRELTQIRTLLTSQSSGQMAAERPRPRVRLNLKAERVLGSSDAPLTVVEFTDFQCPFCNHFYTESFDRFRKNFIETGKVRFYSRDLPLDVHPNALRAALAARCAAEQDQFWAMRDWMSANPNDLDINRLVEHARTINLNAAEFRICVESGKFRNLVESDISSAKDIGVSGTPAFVIGASTPAGVEGELILGAMPFKVFEQKLNDLVK